MRVVISPPQLDIDPVLRGRTSVVLVSLLMKQARLRDLPLKGRKEENICATRVHLVRLSRVDGFLLHAIDFKRVELHVKNLAKVHHHGLMDFLPQVGTENLNEGDL